MYNEFDENDTEENISQIDIQKDAKELTKPSRFPSLMVVAALCFYLVGRLVALFAASGIGTATVSLVIVYLGCLCFVIGLISYILMSVKKKKLDLDINFYSLLIYALILI